jgi:glutathione S-transferase
MKITLERPFAEALSARFPRLSMLQDQLRFGSSAELPLNQLEHGEFDFLVPLYDLADPAQRTRAAQLSHPAARPQAHSARARGVQALLDVSEHGARCRERSLARLRRETVRGDLTSTRGGPSRMKFYMTPGSCSTGIHILLEELELTFEAHVIDLMAGDHLKPVYLAINPRASVPTLVLDDGMALTDFLSIAVWLAMAHPRAKLLPQDERSRARVYELMEHAINVIHGQGFTRIFVTERYAVEQTGRAQVERNGHEIARRGFAALEPLLTPGKYAVDQFSIADAALFYVEFWADRVGLELPSACSSHYRSMLRRRAVQQVLAEEGYWSTLKKHA